MEQIALAFVRLDPMHCSKLDPDPKSSKDSVPVSAPNPGPAL